MRLIDADGLGIGPCKREVFENQGYADGWNAVINILQKANTIDPVKHGRWDFYSGGIINPHFRCSVCSHPRYEHYASNFKYCPNCGARMDLEAEQ